MSENIEKAKVTYIQKYSSILFYPTNIGASGVTFWHFYFKKKTQQKLLVCNQNSCRLIFLWSSFLLFSQFIFNFRPIWPVRFWNHCKKKPQLFDFPSARCGFHSAHSFNKHTNIINFTCRILIKVTDKSVWITLCICRCK